MIPLRDDNPTPGVPYVNYGIIIACALVFFYQLTLGRDLHTFFLLYGILPVRYTNLEIARHFTMTDQMIPFFSSMFLHGGWLHLIGNMWTLYIFGDNVETTMGSARYLLFYILCGVAAALLHLATNLGSQVPTIGASGAIAGVMGAYMVLFPRARVLVLIPIFIFPWIIHIPAFVFLGLWFIIQFFNGAGALAARGDFGGIAWWAHIGGFLTGIFLLRFFLLGRNAGRMERPGRGRNGWLH